MSLIPSSKNNPCPVCENSAGKCRQGREDENYWQCMSYADVRKGEFIAGYKCIGHTRDRLWGQFKLDNSQEWSEQQRQDWQRENQRRRNEQASENEQRRRRSLTAAQRHEQYTRLLSELTLHPDDRADLVRRGFTHEQIELSGFKSIGRYQPLRSRYSELLPGISRGDRLIIPDQGYLCPIRNADGLIVACQVRLRTLPTTESSRYRWLSGGNQTLHLFPEGCKPEGELPLAIFHPQGKPEGIALAEGVGAKPFLVSQRLNLLTIGAAGGQWASSPELFRSTLEKAKSEIEGNLIKIFPDAGDILNPSVMSRWKRVIALLEEWGFSVWVGWWNQRDKSNPDIDELTDYSKVKFITPNHFFSFSEENKKKGFNPQEQKDKGFVEYQAKAKKAWKEAKRFTADIIKASKWCDWKLPPANSTFLGKAGLGRGKSTLLIMWTDLLLLLNKELNKEGKGKKGKGFKGFICLGYRNTLLLQLCEKLGFYHLLHDEKSGLMRHDPNGGIALCVDSLWRFKPEDFDGKVLILDEVMSVIKHLLHSSTVKNREKILELFKEALQRARQVICLDGHLADWAVKLLSELAPDKKIIRAENTYQGQKPTVNFLIGTISEEKVTSEGIVREKVKKNDRSPWLNLLLNGSEVPAVCSDSQIFIESLDNLLTEKGLKVLRIDSKTVSEGDIKELLKDCNAYLEKHQPDVVLYTPSAESGVDISITNYFTHHFCFFFGLLDVDAILQMIGRIRDSKCSKYMWVREFVAQSEKYHTNSPFAKNVGDAITQTLQADILDTLLGIDRGELALKKLTELLEQSKNDPYFEASQQIIAIQNYEKSNLRQCVLESLEEAGYKVNQQTLEPEHEARKEVKEATEETKRQECHDIFTAEKISSEQVDELSRKFDNKWEDRVKVIQALYRSRLPGIDESESWTEDFIYKIKFKNRDFISQQEMFWLFNHPEEANRMNQEKFYKMAQKEKTFIGNYRSRVAKIKALRKIGLEQFFDPEKIWVDDTPELVNLIKQAKDKKISNALGCHQGKQTNLQFLGKLLKMVGLKLKEKKVKSADGSYREYRLDEETLSDPDRKNALDCLDRRWEKYVLKEVEILDWENIDKEALEKNAADERAEEMRIEQAKAMEMRREELIKKREFEKATGTGLYQPLKEVQKPDIKPQETEEIHLNQQSPETQKTDIELLIDKLELCQNADEFRLVADMHDSEKLENAILFADNKNLLRTWQKAESLIAV